MLTKHEYNNWKLLKYKNIMIWVLFVAYLSKCWFFPSLIIMQTNFIIFKQLTKNLSFSKEKLTTQQPVSHLTVTQTFETNQTESIATV